MALIHLNNSKHELARDRAAAFLTSYLACQGVGYAFISTHTLHILDPHWEKGDLHLLYGCTWAFIDQVAKSLISYDTRFKVVSHRLAFDDGENEDSVRIVIDFMPMYEFGLPDRPKAIHKEVNGVFLPILHPRDLLMAKVKQMRRCAYAMLSLQDNATEVFLTNTNDILDMLKWSVRHRLLLCKQRIDRCG